MSSELLDIVERLKEEYGSINKAARMLGMPQGTLHKVAKGVDPRWSTIKLMARAENVPVWELLQGALDITEENSSHRIP